MIKFKECPVCGSSRIKQVRGSVSGVFAGRPYRAKAVLFQECSDCGEKFYDPPALARIQDAKNKAVKMSDGKSGQTRRRAKSSV